MKKRFGCGIGIAILVLLGAGLIQGPLQAATPFVSNFRVDSGSHVHIRLCWDTAAQTNASPVIKTYPTGHPDQVVSSRLNASQGTSTYWCAHVMDLLSDTAYTFYIEYASTSLSSYSDYDSTQSKVVSATYSARTPKEGLIATSVDKVYVMPGESVRLYFENLGTPTNLATAQVGPYNTYTGAYYYHTFTNPTYLFTVTKVGSNYVELKAPASFNDPTKLTYGSFYLDNLGLDAENYKANNVHLITSTSEVNRTTPSGYTGEAYRYLMNSMTFRYNHTRTMTIESTNSIWINSYLKSIGRGVDAVWALVLANSLTYGGYSQAEVKQEINHGPGCLHAYIPQTEWSKTVSYQNCMSVSQ